MRSPARPVTRVPAATGEARHGTDPRQGIARYGIEGRSFRSRGSRPLRHAHHRPHGFDRHRIERTNTGPRAIAADRRSACAGKTVRAKFGKAGLATHRPFRGEAGFTGIPPDGETRFVSNEVVFQAPSNVLVQVVDATARRLGLVAVSSQSLTCRAARCSTRIDNAAAASGWPDPFNL